MRVIALYSCLIGGFWTLILVGVLGYQRSAPSTAMWLFLMGNDGGNSEIYRLHPGTHQLTNLTNSAGVDNFAGISEDGELLLFSSDRGNTGNLDLYYMDWHGNIITPKTYIPPHFQRISPDRQWQAEASVPDGDLEIVLRHRYTGEVRQITQNTIPDYEPAWSANSQHIAYVSTHYGNADIFVMQPDGSHRIRLTTSPHPETTPYWSPLIDYAWHQTNWGIGGLIVMLGAVSSNIIWRRRHS